MKYFLGIEYRNISVSEIHNMTIRVHTHNFTLVTKKQINNIVNNAIIINQ